MSFGSTSETIGYEIIFGLGLLASFPVVILLTILLRWLLRIQSGWFSAIFIGLIYVGGLLGASYYLDTAGTTVNAVVAKKDEVISYREEGDWKREYQVHVTFPASSGSDATSQFRTSEAYFDSLHTGGTVAVRRASINGWFDIARFADQSTWTWIPWNWIGIGLGVLALGFLGWKSLKSGAGCLLMIVLLLILGCLPFAFKYSEWLTSEDTSRTPLQAQGTVEEVERVTTVDPLPGKGSDSNEWETKIDVAQLYDIVVVRYTPQGYEESILGVDAVDAGATNFVPGAKVAIAYAATDPRTVRLADQTRFHHIRNPIEWVKQQLLGLGVIGLFLLLITSISRAWRRMLGRASTA